MEVQEAIADYLKSIKRLGALTQINYAQKLSVFDTWCRTHGVQLEQINNATIDDFLEHLRKEHHSNEPGKAMSSYTLVAYVRQIKTLLTWCLDEDAYGDLNERAIRKIKMPTREQFVKETFTDAQLAALRKACETEYSEHLRLRAQCILALLLSTGIRAEELCTLKVQDVHLDPEGPYVKVHGKGNKWREVLLLDLDQIQGDEKRDPRLDQKTRALLQCYKDQYRPTAPGTAPFFIDRTKKAPMGTDTLEKLLSRLEREAGISEMSCNPHRFRHTFAARFMTVISDIYLLSKMLGHSSVRMTEIYLKSLSGTSARFALLKKLRG